MPTIAVAGMHRSGTSMVTSMLAECGLVIGSQHQLLPPTPENPTGYFERREIVQLNDILLDRLGAAWDHVPDALDAGWLEDARIEALHDDAHRIAATYPSGATWGFKDPRSCFTLPFWERAIDARAAMVICIRNPLDVAASLAKRGGMSQRLACLLWHRYCSAALQLAAERVAVVTHYDAYFHDPMRELRRVTATVGLDASEEQLAQASERAVADHRHAATGLDALARSQVPSQTVALYLQLLSLAGPVMDEVAATDPLVLEPEDGASLATMAGWIDDLRSELGIDVAVFG